MGIPFSSGVQWLFDQHQSYVRSGLKVYLRVTSFPQTGDALEVGVPDVADGPQAGYMDYLIKPPPNVQDISMHNLAMAATAGVNLNLGAKIITVSDSFVQDQIKLIRQQSGVDITDPIAIFRGRDGETQTLGIIHMGREHSIDGITSRQISGRTVSWKLICNTLEQKLADDPDTIGT